MLTTAEKDIGPRLVFLPVRSTRRGCDYSQLHAFRKGAFLARTWLFLRGCIEYCHSSVARAMAVLGRQRPLCLGVRRSVAAVYLRQQWKKITRVRFFVIDKYICIHTGFKGKIVITAHVVCHRHGANMAVDYKRARGDCWPDVR